MALREKLEAGFESGLAEGAEPGDFIDFEEQSEPPSLSDGDK